MIITAKLLTTVLKFGFSALYKIHIASSVYFSLRRLLKNAKKEKLNEKYIVREFGKLEKDGENNNYILHLEKKE